MRSTPWIICHHPDPHAAMRLFCFPYAGSGASAFRLWSTTAFPDVEVCIIQYPGRESRMRSSPFTRLSPLVEAISSSLLPFLDRPFAFYGHSMGALICFELARHLRHERHDLPEHLFIGAQRAPTIQNRSPLLQSLSDEDFVSEIERLYGGIPAVVKSHQELLQLLLPTLRADVTMMETYSYVDEEPLDCPISAFGGLRDHIIKREEISGWRSQTRNSFILRMLPGDHFFIHQSRDLLIKAIAQDLMLFLGS